MFFTILSETSEAAFVLCDTSSRKAPASSHTSIETTIVVVSQTVTHPSINTANCCLTSIVVTLAFTILLLGKYKTQVET